MLITLIVRGLTAEVGGSFVVVVICRSVDDTVGVIVEVDVEFFVDECIKVPFETESIRIPTAKNNDDVTLSICIGATFVLKNQDIHFYVYTGIYQ